MCHEEEDEERGLKLLIFEFLAVLHSMELVVIMALASVPSVALQVATLQDWLLVVDYGNVLAAVVLNSSWLGGVGRKG